MKTFFSFLTMISIIMGIVGFSMWQGAKHEKNRKRGKKLLIGSVMGFAVGVVGRDAASTFER